MITSEGLVRVANLLRTNGDINLTDWVSYVYVQKQFHAS